MRSQLLLFIAIMTISIHTYPFLRKLADTKDSCTKAGKDYEEIPAQCKAGDKIYNVTKEEECKSGTWKALDTPKCSVSTITKQSDCTGTPKYTAAVKGSNTCKKGETNIPRLATNKDTCEVELKWSEGKCSAEEIKESAKCTGTPTFTEGSPKSCKLNGLNIELADRTADVDTCEVALVWDGSACSTSAITNKYDCAGTPKFTAGEPNSCKLTRSEKEIASRATDVDTCEVALEWKDGACSVSDITNQDDCFGIPKFTDATSDSCKLNGLDTELKSIAKDEATCQKKLEWTDGKCNVEEITQKDQCTETPTFKEGETTSEAKCTLGKTEITDKDRLESQTACETPLVWQTSICEGNTAVTVEDICKSSKLEFTAATIKCVEKASSNSNSFLSFKVALILVVYLLF